MGDNDDREQPTGNRLLAFARRLHAVLDDLGEPALWSMSDPELIESVEKLARAVPRLQAQLLAVTAQADARDLATRHGAIHTAGWLRATTRMTGPEATRLVKDAVTLDNHPQTASALAAGHLQLAQAQVITAAVDALPDEVADRRDDAEQHLLAEAHTYDAKALRNLGRYLVEVVAPEHADELIAAQLEREETEAARSAYLRTWSDGNGSRHGRFKIPELQATMLDAMLQALANPARPDPIPREGSASPQVYGLAFAELIERYPTDRLPETGGVNATVVVTIPLETLEGRLKSAELLGTGHRISPGQARRLACAAGVIPAVLDGKSQVLDLGRKRRLHSKAQRIALALNQGGLCNIEHCERPASWSDAHHRQPWSHNGPTDINNGELICPRHHTLVHQGHHYPRRT